MPDINFPNSPSGGDIYTFNNISFTYDGEKWTAKAPVTTSSTYGDANVAAYASSQGYIDLTDISVTSNSPSGNGSLSYNNTNGVLTFTPADASGSGGGSSYGDANVASFLSTNSYSNVAYGNTEVQSYLDAQGYSNTAVSSSSETTFTADVKFDTGVEEKFHTYSSSSGVTAFDCDNGHVHYVTSPSGDITANFTNLGLTAEYTTNLTVIIIQGVTPRVVSAVQIGGSAQIIIWQGGSAPTGTANGIDAFSFTILNDGGSYVVLGQMVDFA